MLKKFSENQADTIRDLIRAMVRPRDDRGFDFQELWVKERGWCVVPVEDSGHFASEEISNVVGALTAAGKESCFAVGSPELPSEFRIVCEIPISEAGLRAFNLEFGVLRALLTDADLSWAISCNEWFNLFAGPQSLVEQMVGVSIDEARREFLAYAGVVEQGGAEGLMRVVRQYS